MSKNTLGNRINELYKTNEKMKNFNGYIYISEKNNKLFSQSFGMANYSTMMPSDCDTIFRMGSITKQFTAMCILILEKQNLLSIDNCLIDYFPDYKNGSHVTIRQLLNMTSGIPEYLIHPEWTGYEVPSNKAVDNYDTYEFVKHLNLEETAGIKTQYSNTNYILLGIVIEKVSGMSYSDFLQKNIFSVLNMTRSGYLPIPKHFDNISIGYKSLTPTPQEADSTIYNTSMGANNIFTSVLDLCKWDAGGTKGFNTMITRNINTKHLIIMLCNVDACEESHIGHYSDLVMECIDF